MGTRAAHAHAPRADAARRTRTHTAQAELVHSRWAMLGVAGILAQSILVPDVWWYDAALHLPAGLGPVNLGSTLAVQFLLMHFVEVRRWQDIRKPGRHGLRRRQASGTPGHRSGPWAERNSKFAG